MWLSYISHPHSPFKISVLKCIHPPQCNKYERKQNLALEFKVSSVEDTLSETEKYSITPLTLQNAVKGENKWNNAAKRRN